MSGLNTFSSSFDAPSLMQKSSEPVEAHVDMTAMIDLVFMLNIFFMVTTLATALAELDLPAAHYVTAADLDKSLLISIVAKGKGDRPQVYIGDVKGGELIPDNQIEDRIATAVQQARLAGKTGVLVKAEKHAPLAMDARVGSAVAAASEEMKLNFAVMEKD